MNYLWRSAKHVVWEEASWKWCWRCHWSLRIWFPTLYELVGTVSIGISLHLKLYGVYITWLHVNNSISRGYVKMVLEMPLELETMVSYIVWDCRNCLYSYFSSIQLLWWTYHVIVRKSLNITWIRKNMSRVELFSNFYSSWQHWPWRPWRNQPLFCQSHNKLLVLNDLKQLLSAATCSYFTLLTLAYSNSFAVPQSGGG